MNFTPARAGDRAGLVAFQNEQFYYLLSVARVAGRTVVQLEKHAGAPTGAWKTLAVEQDGRILSINVAKGFVGTMFGLYATSAAP